MAVAVALLVAAASTAASGPVESHVLLRIAVPDLQRGDDVTEDIGRTVTDTLATEAAKVGGVAVIGASDVRDLLGFEVQKQLMGCSDASCMAEISGALGADVLLVGSLGRVGETWALHLKLVNATDAEVRGRVNRTLRGNIDHVLAELPDATHELMLSVASPTEVSPVVPAVIWSLIGVGGASLVTSVIVEVMARGAYNDATTHHSINYLIAEDYELHSADAREHFDSATRLSRAALGLAIGGAVLATGGVTWLLMRSSEGEHLEVQPSVGGDSAALFLRWSW